MPDHVEEDQIALKYKVVVEIGGRDIDGYNGWFELSKGPIVDNKQVAMLSQANVGSRRLVLSFFNLEPGGYRLWLAIGSSRSYSGSYFVPLGNQIRPVAHGVEKPEWDNVLIPVVPLERIHDDGANRIGMLQPGWLCVFVNGYLWREMEIINDLGAVRDVDLAVEAGKNHRPSSCHIQPHILVPYKLNGQKTHIAFYYARHQSPWGMLCSLGGVAGDDNRFRASVRKASRAIRPNPSLQRDLLQTVDLSAYPDGFADGNVNVIPIDTCPKIGTVSQPNSDLLKPFRQSKIPVVLLAS